MRCKKEKSLYQAPEIVITELNIPDIITTSGPLGGDESDGLDAGGWT